MSECRRNKAEATLDRLEALLGRYQLHALAERCMALMDDSQAAPKTLAVFDALCDVMEAIAGDEGRQGVELQPDTLPDSEACPYRGDSAWLTVYAHRLGLAVRTRRPETMALPGLLSVVYDAAQNVVVVSLRRDDQLITIERIKVDETDSATFGSSVLEMVQLPNDRPRH